MYVKRAVHKSEEWLCTLASEFHASGRGVPERDHLHLSERSVHTMYTDEPLFGFYSSASTATWR